MSHRQIIIWNPIFLPFFSIKPRQTNGLLLEEVSGVDHYESKFLCYFLHLFGTFSLFLVMAIWLDQLWGPWLDMILLSGSTHLVPTFPKHSYSRWHRHWISQRGESHGVAASEDWKDDISPARPRGIYFSSFAGIWNTWRRVWIWKKI